ncbi:hypothetical protein Taro_011036, partial [Colocasia esculenta]|nr:hypothetical protein [Colocasia esculenta]
QIPATPDALFSNIEEAYIENIDECLAVLVPVLVQRHSEIDTIDHEPWSFGEESEDVCRLALLRRYRFIPHIYTLFYMAHTRGTHVVAPTFFADSKDPRLRFVENCFLMGPLLVCARYCITSFLDEYDPRKLDSLKDSSSTSSFPAVEVDQKIEGIEGLGADEIAKEIKNPPAASKSLLDHRGRHPRPRIALELAQEPGGRPSWRLVGSFLGQPKESFTKPFDPFGVYLKGKYPTHNVPIHYLLRRTGVVGDEALVEETLETDSKRGD